MKRTVVRYKAKSEKVEENQRLIEKAFQELQAKSPQGVRYLALKLGDGTFVHFAAIESEDGSLSGLEAFRSFRSGINERCAEPPQASDAAGSPVAESPKDAVISRPEGLVPRR